MHGSCDAPQLERDALENANFPSPGLTAKLEDRADRA
jgi:hypothetical protein